MKHTRLQQMFLFNKLHLFTDSKLKIPYTNIFPYILTIKNIQNIEYIYIYYIVWRKNGSVFPYKSYHYAVSATNELQCVMLF